MNKVSKEKLVQFLDDIEEEETYRYNEKCATGNALGAVLHQERAGLAKMLRAMLLRGRFDE